VTGPHPEGERKFPPQPSQGTDLFSRYPWSYGEEWEQNAAPKAHQPGLYPPPGPQWPTPAGGKGACRGKAKKRLPHIKETQSNTVKPRLNRVSVRKVCSN